MKTADEYIQSVIDHVPRGLPLREQIAMELGSHIAERMAHGQPLAEVLRQLGDPLTLAESYLSAVPLTSARFWPRAFAKIVDFVIACAGAAAVAVIAWLVVPQELGFLVPLLCVLAFLALFPVYTAVAEYRVGQTVGKRMMGIRVVRESGARISLGQALLRQLPFFAQFFWIDVIFALFTDRSQRAFELLTKTRAVMVILCFALFATAADAAQEHLMDVGPPLGQLVDVGGRKLHLHCTGSEMPTVVLESGASSFAVDWALVQPEVATTNRVCSYDRAGYGWSEPGEPERADRAVRDLHTLLERAGEKPPFVLVGASRGGLYTRIYQRRYPDEVIGLVQVDPGHEAGLFTMLNGQPLLIASLTAEQMLASIPEGTPQRPPARQPQTGPPFDRLPGDLYRLRVEFERRQIAISQTAPITRELVVDMMTGEHASLAELFQASRGARPLGDLPIIVLTRGLNSSAGQRSNHESLAAQSTRGRHEVVEGSCHEIHLSHPAAVVTAIREVIELSRKRP